MALSEISCDPGRIPERCGYEGCRGDGIPYYRIENFGTDHFLNPKVVSREYVCSDWRCVVALSNNTKYGLPEKIYDIHECPVEDQRCGVERDDILETVRDFWDMRITISQIKDDLDSLQ